LGKGPGPAPDYIGLANQQGAISQQLNQQQTVANRPNQYSQTGSSTWSQDPSTGQWTQNSVLNPLLQQAYNSQMGTQAGLQGIAQDQLGKVQQDMNINPWQSGSLTAWGTAPQASDQARQDASNAVYNQATSRLDPQWAKAQSEQENQLASMGLHPGDAAYQSQMDAFNRQKTDAYNQANYSSIGAGQNAYNQSFQQSLAGGQFADAQRTQQIGEAGTQSNWDLGNLQRLISGMGVGQSQFGATPGATSGLPQTPDLMGAANQGYQAQVNAANSANQMAGNIAGGALTAAAAFSDERMKDVSGSGEAQLDEFLHSAEGSEYQYRPEHQDEAGGGTYVTPMAQRLEQSQLGRDFVSTDGYGRKVVDYGKGLGTLTAALSHVNKKLDRVMSAWGTDDDKNPEAVVAWGRRR
jgi:hypothetical protein